MPDVQALPPEMCRNVASVARALVAAARSWTLYPPDHPAVRATLDRLHAAVRGAADGRAFSFGVTPTDLLVEGLPIPGEAVVAEAAAWLHARDIVQLTIAGDADVAALQRLLALLSGEGRGQARPARRAEDHRQLVAAGGTGPHVAPGADRAEALRQRHLHAHGERLGAGDGAGAVAQPAGPDAARVRIRGADARHRQGQYAAGGAEQTRQADRRRIPHHAAARRRRRAHPAADAGDARARLGRRVRASSAAGPVRLSGEHRPPDAEPVHADRQHRRRVRCAAQQARVYRDGLSSERVRAIMMEKDSPAFNSRLLRRFVNLIGLFPVGTAVRLNTDEIGVVVHEHASDPFRPQVKIVRDRDGAPLESPLVVNTWEAAGGEARWAVVEAVDPDAAGFDPLQYM